MKKSSTLTATSQVATESSLYRQIEQVRGELSIRLNELEFAHYVLSLERSDWEGMRSDLAKKIASENFVSDRREVENLMETISHTVDSYGKRIGEISVYTKEAKTRLATIKSALASLDIMENIALAIKGGVNTEGFPSLSNDSAESELRSIKTLLHTTNALVELRSR